MQGVTKKRILQFVNDYIEENGYSPTVREIGKAVGLKSTSTVHKHLQDLTEMGMLEKQTVLSRTIRSKLPEVKTISSRGGVPIRIEWDGRTYRLEE